MSRETRTRIVYEEVARAGIGLALACVVWGVAVLLGYSFPGTAMVGWALGWSAMSVWRAWRAGNRRWSRDA